jgi:hypothetical protein
MLEEALTAKCQLEVDADLYEAELAAACQACRDGCPLRVIVALCQERRLQPGRQTVAVRQPRLLRWRMLGCMWLQQLTEARSWQSGRIAERLRQVLG